MRIKGDMLPNGALITALVQRGEDLCAKSQTGCVILPHGLVKLEHAPPLEELTPMMKPPTFEA